MIHRLTTLLFPLVIALCAVSARADSPTLFTFGDQEPFGQSAWQFVQPFAINGQTVVGSVRTGIVEEPFIFNIATGTATVLDLPLGEARGVFGNTVVGHYQVEHSSGEARYNAFIFDGVNITTVLHPQVLVYDIVPTSLFDFDGQRALGVVGGSYPTARLFTYDGADFEYIDLPPPQPGAIEGFPDLIDGVNYGVWGQHFRYIDDRILGTMVDETSGSPNLIQFLLDGDQYITFEGPMGESIIVTDIQGETLVGMTGPNLQTPVLFHGGEWIYLKDIDPNIQNVYAIDGDRVVGAYTSIEINNSLGTYGYILQLDALNASEVPEPASAAVWSLLALGAAAFGCVRRRVRTARQIV